MSYQNLLVESRDGVAFVTINRPDKLNALNDATVAEIDAAFAAIAADPATRGVVLTGAGEKAFVAGADIAELATQSPVDGKERSIRGQRVLDRIERLGKPVIAAVNGFALGGGCELAMACHVRVASRYWPSARGISRPAFTASMLKRSETGPLASILRSSTSASR